VPDPLVLGVDPGSKFCGLALVRGRDDLVAWYLLERPEGQDIRVWVEECCLRAKKLAEACAVHWRANLVAVEAVNTPQSHINGKRRLNSPESLIGTAAVMGGIIAWAASEGFPSVLVPPGGNGDGPREAYPAELWGAREGPAGTGKLGHVRSSYDCALAGPGLLRRATAEVGTAR
jgi:hypothetical protein